MRHSKKQETDIQASGGGPAPVGQGDPPDRRKRRCLLIFITFLPVLLVVNPLAFWLVLPEEASFELAYVLLFDVLALIIMWLCYRHVQTGRAVFHGSAVASVFLLPLVLIAAEALMLQNRAAYHRLKGVDERPDASPMSTLQRHDSFGWWLRPGAETRSPSIIVDDQGRRHTEPPAEGVTRTIHVFGDSFVFGQGVGQDGLATNLLAKKFRDQAAILNYAVSGYGLEQMALRLEAAVEAIKPGDLVLIVPITNDFYRNLINKQLVCTHYEGGLGSDRFPKLVEGEWRYEQLEDHCPELGLPFKGLLEAVRKNTGITERRLLANADRIMHRARHIAHQKGAAFALIFQPNVKECQKGRFDIDLDGLTVPHHHLMASCQDFEPGIAYTLSAEDYHWNENGHRWLANALGDFIEAERLL